MRFQKSHKPRRGPQLQDWKVIRVICDYIAPSVECEMVAWADTDGQDLGEQPIYRKIVSIADKARFPFGIQEQALLNEIQKPEYWTD